MVQDRSSTGQSLRSRASRLFTNLDGRVFTPFGRNAVRQGTLSGPTLVQRERLASLTRQLDEQLESLNRLSQTAVSDLDRQMNEANLAPYQGGCTGAQAALGYAIDR